jgi:hypothetical protein
LSAHEHRHPRAESRHRGRGLPLSFTPRSGADPFTDIRLARTEFNV